MKLRGPKPLIWRGYRNCDVCTRWRPVSDFTVYKTRTGYEQIKGECEYCKRERERERYHSLTPEQKKAKGRRANRQAQKRRDKALAYIERQREILDKQNDKIERLEQKVEHTSKLARKRVRYLEDGDYLDIVPFRMWLLRKNRETGYNIDELSEWIGQDPSRVQRWLNGYQWNGAGRDPEPVLSVHITTVDAVAVKVGDTGLLERLYPLSTED